METFPIILYKTHLTQIPPNPVIYLLMGETRALVGLGASDCWT
jgi:hypothetical protein